MHLQFAEKFKLVELITTRTDAVVTFLSGNTIKFNAATHIDLGYPEAIQLFVDEKGRQFAIKACKETDPEAIGFSRPAGEQKYPIKITCGPTVTLVRRIMGWENNQNMNAPGAIFRDEGVIIFALEQAFVPVPKGGGWNAKRKAEAEAAALNEDQTGK